MPDDEEWRTLAEEAAQEQDPKKLMEIINSLTAALDERVTRKAAGQQPIPFKKANSDPKSPPSKPRQA